MLSTVILCGLTVVWIILPLCQPKTPDFIAIASSNEIVNTNFDYLASSASSKSSKHSRAHSYGDDNSGSSIDLVKRKMDVSPVSYSENLSVNKNVSSRIGKQENNGETTGGGSVGMYFSRRGNGTMLNSSESKYSSAISVDAGSKDGSSINNPQAAPSATNDGGGDPGGDPTGNALPLKDDLLALSLLILAYTAFIIKKKSRK